MIVKAKTAKLLADKGFDIEGENYYLNNELFTDTYFPSLQATKPNGAIFAPKQWLVQKWLREKGIFIEITPDLFKGELYYTLHGTYDIITGKDFSIGQRFEYSTYEEALENGIIEAIKLL